jgi:lauroyl/myristoyl acyltransferase
MKRTVRGEAAPDYSPLLRAIMYLDEALKRGVVIGVYEDSKEVSDEDVRKALIGVNALMAQTTAEMEKLSRAIVRVTHQPGSLILQ